MIVRSYRELIRLPTFEERFEYLKLGGVVGRETFGFDRYLNQILYKSKEWKLFRRDMIVRDSCCDLAMLDREIHGLVIVHHINPITIEDIENRNPCVFDPDNTVCSSHTTHNAIHYGDKSLLITLPKERRKGDTIPWKAY